jgi:hypothetical protein
MSANTATREQCNALHLFDLCRAYPRHPAAAQVQAALEEHRLRGAEARKQAEIKAAQANQRYYASPAHQLATARRVLIKLIGERGGLAWHPQERRLVDSASASTWRWAPKGERR